MAEQLRDAADLPNSASLRCAVARLVAAGPRAGLFFDFDGVLAPIQDDPVTVQPEPGMRRALTELSGVVGRLALVSSRPVEFLHDRLGAVPRLELHGLYGLEHMNNGQVVIDPAARPWLPAVRRLAREAASALPEVYVEDKALSVGLHYRLAPHRRAAIEAWAADAQRRTGFVPQPGRMVVELRPPIPMDKGVAVARLAQDLEAAWFFGDDVGDVPAFAELHRRAAGAAGRFSALAVGVGNDTVVAEVAAQADVLLPTPALVVELLRHLRARFGS